MEGELHEGSVPAYYRDVHEAISRPDGKVQVEVFQRLLQRSALSQETQNQICVQVELSGGCLSKLSLYRALALIGLAQQGKQQLDQCSDLPKPDLGEPTELRALRTAPAEVPMSETLDKLLERDSVQVELIPEKKGLFLKHVEYQVTSQRFGISVCRRYSDFDVLHEVLLQRFYYRGVPALPPKRKLKGVLTSLSEPEFIEQRRRGLCRFLSLVARHPFFSEDELVKTFLTFSGSELQTKLRDIYKQTGDEFLTHSGSAQAKELLAADVKAQFSTSRDLIRNIHGSFQRLRDRAEKMAERSKDNAADLLVFGKELSALGSEATPLPCTWETLREPLRTLSVDFKVLSEKALQQDRREEDDVVEKLNLFLDLLQSYKDLCERHEKGEQQKALQNYGVMRRQVEQRTVQESLELRSSFSTLCLHQETQIVFAYLHITSHIIGALVNSQVRAHREMGTVWAELQPKLGRLFGNKNGLKPQIMKL